MAFAAGDEIVLSGTAKENVHRILTADGVQTVSGNGPVMDDVYGCSYLEAVRMCF